MFTVQLDTIRLWVPVGLYRQEAVLKNEIIVNIAIRVPGASPGNLPFIDYAMVYKVVQESCEKETGLLEQLLNTIYCGIQTIWPDTLINISISKLHPPMGGRVSAATVSWSDF